MSDSRPALDRVGFLALTASLAIVQIKIAPAQILFGVAAIIWLVLAIRDKQLDAPRFFWPLVAYGAFTLVSAAFSSNPYLSFIDCKQLVLFLMVPVTARLARGERAMTTLNVILAVGAVGALVGVTEYAVLGYDNLDKRPTGTLSHYMTYSGVIMLALGAAVARLLFYRDQLVWPAIAVPAMLVAIAVTQARNAWIGALAAIAALLAAKRLKLLLALPVLIAIFVFAAPANLRDRAFSIFDRNNATNRDRFAMLSMGRHIIADHPLFGVGPDRIKVIYADYRPSWAENPTNPHLHNVPVNIAAERGLPALALWLWFIGVAAYDLFRQVRRGPAVALAAAGLAAIVGMLAAGMFEYNFGDSEFLMLFLGLITLPYAARHVGAAASRREGQS